MRIIAGVHRSRKLKCPEGNDITRPVTDRVKQALFDRLSSREAIAGHTVLDIFSGVGSMGLECLSRSARHVYFLEKHPKIIKYLEENIALLSLEKSTEILRVDAFSKYWLRQFEENSIGLCFLDPPYPLVQDEKSNEQIKRLMETLASYLAPLAWVVLRTPKRHSVSGIEGLAEPEIFNYGGMNLCLYQKK